MRASLNAVNDFYHFSDYAEAQTKINITLTMIGVETAAGTTAPALLKKDTAQTHYFDRPEVCKQLAGFPKLCRFTRKTLPTSNQSVTHRN